LAKCYKQLGK
jgi:lipopolysaccharide biosynthesis regulator YciM